MSGEILSLAEALARQARGAGLAPGPRRVRVDLRDPGDPLVWVARAHFALEDPALGAFLLGALARGEEVLARALAPDEPAGPAFDHREVFGAPADRRPEGAQP